MTRKLLSSFLILFLLSGCGLYGTQTDLIERLESLREPGTEWSIKVKYWPDRFQDPYTQEDTPLVSTNRYRVLESPETVPKPRILLEGDSKPYLLQLYPSGNVELASRILSEDTTGVVKTQAVLANSLQGQAFFDPDWAPSEAIFLFHPDVSAQSSRQRMRFDRESGHSGDWVIQTTDRTDTAVDITLRHKPTRSRVEFHWPRNEVWWERARWYRSGRIVATARRLN